MGYKEYDAFKQQLREWMDSHPKEYSAFEAEMNRMDGVGYQKIMAQAVTLVPKYKKAVEKKMDVEGFSDVTGLEILLADNKIGEKLLKALNNTDNTAIPAMFC